MKKITFLAVTALFLLSTLMGGCGGGPATSTVLFQDDFNYTATAPINWTPTNGWTGVNWAIVTGGFSGNGIQYNPPIVTAGYLINDYSGSNYKISARINPASVVSDNSEVGIIGRFVSDTSYYRAVLCTTSGAGHPTDIRIIKAWVFGATGYNGTLQSDQFLTGPMTPGTFYDMTFTITGISPVTLVARVSDGTNTKEITVTDDGTFGAPTAGPPIASGKVGCAVIPFSVYHPIFDSFLVTTP